jgi:hypothetical protein
LGAGVVFGEEPLAHSYLLENRGHMACNAFLASTAGHPFWRLVIALMQERSRAPKDFSSYGNGDDFSSDPVSSTGPRLLHHAYDVWTNQVAIPPHLPAAFLPLARPAIHRLCSLPCHSPPLFTFAPVPSSPPGAPCDP